MKNDAADDALDDGGATGNAMTMKNSNLVDGAQLVSNDYDDLLLDCLDGQMRDGGVTASCVQDTINKCKRMNKKGRDCDATKAEDVCSKFSKFVQSNAKYVIDNILQGKSKELPAYIQKADQW